VFEDGVKKWIAVPTIEVKVGDSFYYKRNQEVLNFEDKELERKFDSILFLGFITKVKSLDDFISIEELYKNKKKYSRKKIKVRGKVVKFSGEIMGKKWLHIEDGTGFEGDNDLTITCQENVMEGTVVIFEGIITLNKDFGAQYFYEIIMEDAVLLK